MAVITKTIDMLMLPLAEGKNSVSVTSVDTEPGGIALLESARSGATEINSGGFEYALNEDGKSYCIVSRGDVATKTIVIPPTYNNKYITKIGENAFANSDIISVELPPKLTHIGKYAFHQCRQLATVTFTIGAPSELEVIDDFAFSSTDVLNNMYIPATVRSIGSYAFWLSGLATVTFAATDVLDAPELHMGDHAFTDCKLTKVTFPQNLRSIGQYAFAGCTQLTSLQLGTGLVTIGDCAFMGCSLLEHVAFGYTKEEGTYLSHALTTIGEKAFCNCNQLNFNLGLPNSLNWIGKRAFYCMNTAVPSLPGHIIKCRFDDEYAWFKTENDTPVGGEFIDVARYNDDDAAMGEFINMQTDAHNIYKLDRMPAPVIEKDGTNLVITDSTGIADEFKIFVGDNYVARLKVDGTLELI